MAVLSDILYPALRLAGITRLPGTTPSTDQRTELIPAINNLISSYNLDGNRIYSTKIENFLLSTGDKELLIGPGAPVLNTTRPIFIQYANNMYPTDPVVRRPIQILETAEQWASIMVQDISGAPIQKLYYDSSQNSSGQGKVYIWPQPPTDYRLELFSWEAMLSAFTAVSDVIICPPGYVQMLTFNLAVIAASLYPRESAISQDTRDQARKSLDLVRQNNARNPVLWNEAASISGRGGNAETTQYKWWISGLS